jgi:hypothetical protein
MAFSPLPASIVPGGLNPTASWIAFLGGMVSDALTVNAGLSYK